MGMGEGPPRAGTRGGRDRFSWQDVKDDHRNAGHYLGASIKAPSGRWAANKDLEWFNKPAAGQGGSDNRADMVDAAAARREEVRRIKEAEEDAVLRALGKPVPDRTPNTNLEPLGVPSTMQAKNLQEETAPEKESFARHRPSRRRHRSRSREGSRRRSRSRSPDRRRRRSPRSPDPRESTSRRSHDRYHRRSRSRSRSRLRDRHSRRSRSRSRDRHPSRS